MKLAFVFSFLFCMVAGARAQDLPSNQVHLTAGVINSDYTMQGNWLGANFNVGYSRYIFKRVYLDVAAGKGHFQGKNSSRYDLRDDERENLNLTTYGIGAGYDFIRTEKLSLAGQLHLNSYNYMAVTGLITDGEGNVKYRGVDPVNENHLAVGLRIRNRLGEHTAFVTNIGYDLAYRLERVFFNTGLSFSF